MAVLSGKSVLETALAHRSIRKFTGAPIAPEQLDAVLEAGRAASSSSFLQTVHIIRVSDEGLRKGLREVGADQHYIETCAEFLVFCMDFAKHKQIAPDAQTDWTEVTLIGAIDAGIMAQNIMLAAESLDLGAVYIGSLRNDVRRVAELLDLPEYVMPLFGMCLGHPDQDPLYRPRLPLECMVSENQYQALNIERFIEYNAVIKDYYQRRSNLDLDWEAQIRATLCREVRPDILPFLQKQGFAKK
ncbi:oxygen-insensitive NADPH nitroreductase [Uruburuella testudinis]|uniref:Oxygen-insensitive NADPH nitroreductase n=1 Tax=Uruburuella testudinis TaxID=1282863 RepID=A0ABY4DXI5_9NEIS|nr:oxygen-insensitive NADPH nitroreductase [Uruburuella testudinis]UOO81411.1 oxygen-insensitive NADPH nitroreductase [Uruburuella testudinis]